MIMNCKNCIHRDVCRKCEEHVTERGCDNFKNSSDVLISVIPIGATVHQLVNTLYKKRVIIDGVEYYRNAYKWHIETFKYDWTTAVVDSQRESIEGMYFFDIEQARIERNRRNEEEDKK